MIVDSLAHVPSSVLRTYPASHAVHSILPLTSCLHSLQFLGQAETRTTNSQINYERNKKSKMVSNRNFSNGSYHIPTDPNLLLLSLVTPILSSIYGLIPIKSQLLCKVTLTLPCYRYLLHFSLITLTEVLLNMKIM